MDRSHIAKKILIVAGSRGEYGYVRPIIREIEKAKDFDYEMVVCNMHPLDTFGSSIEEIKKDGIRIGAVVHNTLDGYSRLTMTKSLGIFMMELPAIIERINPDFMLIAGDRGEQFIAAIVGAHMYIPVVHIQAGELSGNIDGTVRHAITKLAHIHLCSNKDAAQRVRKMGEEPFRIFNIGAPQLDELITGPITSKREICRRYGIKKDKPSILLVQHSVTEEFDQTEKQIIETMKAVVKSDYQTIIVLNNSDAGSKAVRSIVLKYRTPKMKIFENMPRADYAGIMNTVSVLVGNSSSGIIEAPLFKLPVVNIGNRQRGRMHSTNVINVGHNMIKIKSAIQKAISPAFKKQAAKAVSLYGDGKSSKRILDILAKMKPDNKLLVKHLTY